MEKAGVAALDLLAVLAGTPELSVVSDPIVSTRLSGSPYAGYPSAVSIPVFVAGRVVVPEDAEAVLQSGSADFISLGRAFCRSLWCAGVWHSAGAIRRYRM